MKKVILVILLVSAVVFISTCAKRKEGHCKLKYQAVDTLESTIYLASQNLIRLSRKPAQLKDLPKNKSGRFLYRLAKIAETDIPVVIDRTNKNKFKLYMDTDGDGYLSDEKRFISKAVKRRLFGAVDHYKFGPISVEFDKPDGKYTKRIYIITRNSLDYRHICPADYRRGKILLGHNIYNVAVVDGDFDGKYGNIFSPPVKTIWRPGCDSFAIDLNRDGKLDFDYYYNSEIMPLGQMVRVGNSYYSINIAESGTSLELKKIQPEFGTLDLGYENVRLKLWSDAAQQFISNIKSNGPIPAVSIRHFLLNGAKSIPKKRHGFLLVYLIPVLCAILKLTRMKQLRSKLALLFRLKQEHRKSGKLCRLILSLRDKQGSNIDPMSTEMVDEFHHQY